MEALFSNKEVISNTVPSLSVALMRLVRCDWNMGHVAMKWQSDRLFLRCYIIRIVPMDDIAA